MNWQIFKHTGKEISLNVVNILSVCLSGCSVGAARGDLRTEVSETIVRVGGEPTPGGAVTEVGRSDSAAGETGPGEWSIHHMICYLATRS